MWLITYSQRAGGAGSAEIKANTVTNADCTPPIWLGGMIQKYPSAETKLLFAIEINDAEGEFLRGIL